ncbi:hypothetical protein M413DRAFT_24679 [Hebeloma cylindrosporum]|uniref:Uncharacterized protein n=1 Tax=Hebeloma cylindrosporum TaxID=76867 RepID=A0A0C3CMX8_HEBCY|nr:hypothetical protein M413DRAFT_24679 [Hebeloma cylindrosporum h7]
MSKSPVLVPMLESLHILILFPYPEPPFQQTPLIAISELLSNVEVSRLRCLQLKFRDDSNCRDAYFALQPSPQVGGLDDDVLALLNSWKNQLLEDIPQVVHGHTPRWMLVNVMHWRRLDQLFTAIEGYDIPTSGYLHVSKLHFVMYAIGRTLPGHSEPAFVPGNKRYNFCGRAKALLARWEPILLKDLHCYQWLHTELKVLTYVPQGSDFRESSSAIDLIYSHAGMSQFYLENMRH